MIHNCCAFGTADLQQCPPLGSAAGAAAGAEAGAEARAEARAEAGAVVEARTATGGSISQRPNGLECRETRGGSSTVLVTWPEAGYEEHGGGVQDLGGGSWPPSLDFWSLFLL